jgi:hypothetical protein
MQDQAGEHPVKAAIRVWHLKSHPVIEADFHPNFRCLRPSDGQYFWVSI